MRGRFVPQPCPECHRREARAAPQEGVVRVPALEVLHATGPPRSRRTCTANCTRDWGGSARAATIKKGRRTRRLCLTMIWMLWRPQCGMCKPRNPPTGEWRKKRLIRVRSALHIRDRGLEGASRQRRPGAPERSRSSIRRRGAGTGDDCQEKRRPPQRRAPQKGLRAAPCEVAPCRPRIPGLLGQPAQASGDLGLVLARGAPIGFAIRLDGADQLAGSDACRRDVPPGAVG